MKKFWLIGCIFFASACGGKEVFIADQVRFRVLFGEKKAQVSFQINKDYQVKQALQKPFEDLGSIFIKWYPEQNFNEIGTSLSADPSNLEKPWPKYTATKMPGGSKLPPSVPQSKISAWDQKKDSFSFTLFFDGQPELIAGGAIMSDDFNSLPKGFLATQTFKADNGDVVATISILGPNTTSSGARPGGLVYFGNFGVPPFDMQTDKTGIQEWSVPKKDPAEILDMGKSSLSIFSMTAEGFLKKLEASLASLSP